ncbi:hypothetical protein CF128_19335 [Aeromonas veronii]|nr:hypothetical protein CF128_19335 [Aeromonas veronii]
MQLPLAPCADTAPGIFNRLRAGQLPQRFQVASGGLSSAALPHVDHIPHNTLLARTIRGLLW